MQAIVLAEPGTLRDALALLLSHIGQVERVDLADDGAALLQQARTTRWDVVLIVAGDDSQSVQDSLRRIKAGRPQTRCVVLINDAAAREPMEQAGADVVLMVGHPAAEFACAVKRLFYPSEGAGIPEFGKDGLFVSAPS